MGDKFNRQSLHEFPLSVLTMDPQGPVDSHTHTFDELVVITGGRGTHVIDDEAYTIQAGDAFVITPSRVHGYRDTDHLALINILFYMDKLPIPVGEMRKLPGYHAFFLLEPEYREQHRFESRLRLTVDELADVSKLLKRLQDELNARGPGYEFCATGYFMQLIAMLARSYAGHRTNRVASPLLGIGEVISLLENRYMDDITIEMLTDIAHMSKSSVLRAFRRAMATTPMEYLIRLRVLHAAELLRTGSSVADAAYQVGFHDSNYFTRQFRRMMGTTPTHYRAG